MMKRVGARMLKKELVDLYTQWKEAWRAFAEQQKYAELEAKRKAVLSMNAAEFEAEMQELTAKGEEERLQQQQERGERIMRGVAAQWRNKEVVFCWQTLKAGFREHLQRLEAERRMRKVGARLMMREVVFALQAMKEHLAVYLKQQRAERMMRRVGARLRLRDVVFALQQAKANLAIHRNKMKAETIFRRVGARWLMGERVYAIQAMKAKVAAQKKMERGEVMMRRVGARLLKKECVFALQAMKMQHQEHKEKDRGERMMRRVGAKMLMREVVEMMQRMKTNFDVFKQKARGDLIMRRVAGKMLHKEMVYVLTNMKVNHLDAQMKDEAETKMRRVGAKMLMGEQLDAIDTWKENWTIDRNKARGERLMRRVGARLTQREVVLCLKVWMEGLSRHREESSQERLHNAKQRRVVAFFARQTMSLQELILNAFKRHHSDAKVHKLEQSIGFERSDNRNAQERAVDALAVETELRIKAEAELEQERRLTASLQANAIELADSQRQATIQMKEVQAVVAELTDSQVTEGLQKQAILDKALREKLMHQLQTEREAREEAQERLREVSLEKSNLEQEFERHKAGAEAAVESISLLQGEVDKISQREGNYATLEARLAQAEQEKYSLEEALRKLDPDGSGESAATKHGELQKEYANVVASKKQLHEQHSQLQGWYAELQAEVVDVLHRRDQSNVALEGLEEQLRERDRVFELKQELEDKLRVELAQEKTFAQSLEAKWQQWFEEALIHMPEIRTGAIDQQDAVVIARRAFEWVQELHRSEWSAAGTSTQDVDRVFDMMDQNTDGVIDRKEFRAGFENVKGQ